MRQDSGGKIKDRPSGSDPDGDKKIDNYTSSTFYNYQPEWLFFGGEVTIYDFNVETNELIVTKYKNKADANARRNGTLFYKGLAPKTLYDFPFSDPVPAPRSLNSLTEDSTENCVSFQNESVYYYASRPIATFSQPSTWEYQLYFPKDLPRFIQAGYTLTIGCKGIQSASVTGDAALSAFGAWQVKVITEDAVAFEAMADAEVSSSFGGFSITAPDKVNGLVFWLTTGEEIAAYGDTLGSVGGE